MRDYDITEAILKSIDKERKPTLLLHSCCAPCSTTAIDLLKDYFDITVFYYNPNIYPEQEYLKRKSEQIRLCSLLNIKIMDADYNPQEYESSVIGLEGEKEGGKRCGKCFLLRLSKTEERARKDGYAYFSTTLTVSPHKNSQVINTIGRSLESTVKYLPCDLKKKDGYLRSIRLSEEYGLYRQNYCGCRYSLQKDEN